LHTTWHARIAHFSRTSWIRCPTQILLLLCDDCFTLSGCIEVSLIEDMQELVQTYQQNSISL
jgi:hypothetical protein